MLAATGAILGYLANVFKIKDAVTGPSVSPSFQPLPSPSQKALTQLTLAPSPTISPEKTEEKINITTERTGRAFDGAVVVTVVGITYEETAAGSLGHKITIDVNSVGSVSKRYTKKEAGFVAQFKGKGNDLYEIRVMSADTFNATFLVSKITKSL